MDNLPTLDGENERESGMIPMNHEDFPIEVPLLDESETYPVALANVTVNPTADKSGCAFIKHSVIVGGDEFDGKTLTSNWMRLPRTVPPGASNKVVREIRESNVPITRFCRAYGIEALPEVDLSDVRSLDRFHQFIQKYYGREARVSVQNSEFPKGSGRRRSSIQDYII